MGTAENQFRETARPSAVALAKRQRERQRRAWAAEPPEAPEAQGSERNGAPPAGFQPDSLYHNNFGQGNNPLAFALRPPGLQLNEKPPQEGGGKDWLEQAVLARKLSALASRGSLIGAGAIPKAQRENALLTPEKIKALAMEWLTAAPEPMPTPGSAPETPPLANTIPPGPTAQPASRPPLPDAAALRAEIAWHEAQSGEAADFLLALPKDANPNARSDAEAAVIGHERQIDRLTQQYAQTPQGRADTLLGEFAELGQALEALERSLAAGTAQPGDTERYEALRGKLLTNGLDMRGLTEAEQAFYRRFQSIESPAGMNRRLEDTEKAAEIRERRRGIRGEILSLMHDASLPIRQRLAYGEAVGAYRECAQLQFYNIRKRLSESAAVIDSGVGAQTAAATLCAYVAAGYDLNHLDALDEATKEELRGYNAFITKAMGLEGADGLFAFMDEALGGALSATAYNEGIGTEKMLVVGAQMGAAKFNDILGDMMGAIIGLGGYALQAADWLYDHGGSFLFGWEKSGLGDTTNRLIESGKSVAGHNDKTLQNLDDYLKANAATENRRPGGPGVLGGWSLCQRSAWRENSQ